MNAQIANHVRRIKNFALKTFLYLTLAVILLFFFGYLSLELISMYTDTYD